MSQADMIKQGEIAKRKQARLQAVIAAKAALRSLANAAAYAMTKAVEEINTAELMVHLAQLTEKQEEIARLDAEIKDLEY